MRAYGTSVEFRDGLVAYGLDYAVGINGTTKVWTLDARDRQTGLTAGVRARAAGYACSSSSYPLHEAPSLLGIQV